MVARSHPVSPTKENRVSPAEIQWLADQEDVELETIWDHAAASRYLNSTCPTVSWAVCPHRRSLAADAVDGVVEAAVADVAGQHGAFLARGDGQR